MIRVASIVALLFLGGCTPKVIERPEPIVVAQKSYIPVTGACVPKNFKEAPEYPDTAELLRAAKDAAERYFLMAAGWPLRDARLKELEIVAAGCPKAGK